MKRYICPNNTCKTRRIKHWQITENRQGELCEECKKMEEDITYQKITCNSCGVIYEIRDKIKISEENYVERGMCAWCAQRKYEEDELIKKGRMTEEERTKVINMNNIVNRIINKKKDEEDYGDLQ